MLVLLGLREFKDAVPLKILQDSKCYFMHCALYTLGLNMPLCLFNVIINWHLKLKGCVIWNGVFSASFTIKSSVRQGSSNSSWFFNVYIHELIVRLRNSGYGCTFCFEFVGCLIFADDILLLSASVIQLQSMLDICYEYGVQFDIKFNALKSNLLQIGLDVTVKLPILNLGESIINWSSQIKYLGILIAAGKRFCVESDYCRRKFLSSVFAILQHCNNISEEINCNIIAHSCLPILCYGVDVLSLSSKKIHDLNVALNIAVRRCFRMSKYSSVRGILCYMGMLPIPILFQERRFLLIRD